MKRNFAKQLLCSVVALMLGIGTVGTVAAQEFVLPEGVKATPAQLKEIKTYYDKAPLLEKFFILTALPLSISYDSKLLIWDALIEQQKVQIDMKSVGERVYKELPNGTSEQKRDRENQLLYNLYEFNIEKVLSCIEWIKECKAGRARSSNYRSDTIAYKNGYAFLDGRALTYWKYGDAYLIATNRIIDGCCEASYHSEPAFFLCTGNVITEIPFFKIVKPLSDRWDNLPQIEWYDLYTLKEYMAVLMANDECGYGWNYELPTSGKDIKVPSASGCGVSSTDYTAWYRWNGDGTFTKTGRADSLKKEIIKERDLRGY